MFPCGQSYLPLNKFCRDATETATWTGFLPASLRDLAMLHLMGDSITQIGAEVRCIKSRRNWSEFFPERFTR